MGTEKRRVEVVTGACLSCEAVLAASASSQFIQSIEEVRPSFAGSKLIENGLNSYTL